MKNVIYVSGLLISLLILSITTKGSEVENEVTNYTVVKVSDEYFLLQNSTEKLPIEVKKENETTFYIVRGNDFEVMYINGDFGFGLRAVPKKWQILNKMEFKFKPRSEVFLTQSVLSSSKLSNQQALLYIADFLPEVFSIKD